MTGHNAEHLHPKLINLKAVRGQKGRIVIRDNSQGGFGHINVDDISLTDRGTIIDVTFPTAHTIYQRSLKDNRGEVSFSGKIYGKRVSKLEASFNGGSFTDVTVDEESGTFKGMIKAPTGQGRLIVRAGDDKAVQTRVEPVSANLFTLSLHSSLQVVEILALPLGCIAICGAQAGHNLPRRRKRTGGLSTHSVSSENEQAAHSVLQAEFLLY